MSEPPKKEFHPAYVCGILPTNLVILAIIAIPFGAGSPGYMVVTVIAAFYLLACIPLSIVTFVKIGVHAKKKRLARQIAANAALRQSMVQQRPQHYQQGLPPQASLTADPIYQKGLEAVAEDIVNQLVPRPAPRPTVAATPQTVTTVSASVSTPIKPVAKVAEAIASPEAVAAKRAMLERVLAPQSSEAQALATEVMGSIAGTKAVKGLKKGAAGGAEDGGTTPEVDQTEEEVTTIKDQKICIVHKGPISGAIFLCKCEAFYCMACAQHLKKKGEKCWSCGAEIDVPDMPT
ncbi:MAG: hypothetical protein JW839_18635 [Candidatus Lokiarchaeota archaeon]|nr:hypothetical protein [Candidatus Lokiarchaeota archaeon]